MQILTMLRGWKGKGVLAMWKANFEQPGDGITYKRHVTVEQGSFEFHLHNEYEIYFFIRGDVHYFVENSIYALQYGDLLLFNSYEIHRATFLSDKPYERVVIHFSPELMDSLSTQTTDILRCFRRRPKGEKNLLRLSEHQIVQFLSHTDKISQVCGKSGYGADVLTKTYLAELLVYINILFENRESGVEKETISAKIQEMLEYIDNNIQGNLSLESLEQRFLTNRYTLSRDFKKETGSTIYSHIIAKRISCAKQLLEEGQSVMDACAQTGFNDYTNFIRTFKKVTGMTPHQYRKVQEKRKNG